jgi:orotate phosphoribosyltransferase
MEKYKKNLARILAETEALFFDKNLILKDGRPTPYFVNFGMFRTGRLSLELGSFFAEMMVSNGIAEKTDIILGPSYKGSAIALSTSIALYSNYDMELFFEYDRKEAKSHGESSKSSSMMVNKTLFEGCHVFIVDDVATSMGTKYDLLETLEAETKSNGITINIVGIGIAIDREQTTAVYDNNQNVILKRKGKNAINDFTGKTNVPVYIVAGITEVIEYLFNERIPVMIEGKPRPIDDEIKSQFDEYIEIYGIE